MKKFINQPGFRQWIEESLERGENVLAVSNQGTILLYRKDGIELIVKTAMGRGPVRLMRHRTLLREYEAYQRMYGLTGVPECYGMVDGRYLVIEYIHGVPYREANWTNRETWFVEFLEVEETIALGLSAAAYAATAGLGNLPCSPASHVAWGADSARMPGKSPYLTAPGRKFG